MKHDQYLVRCKIKGQFYNVDVLDLEEESFRAFVLSRLAIGRLLVGIKEEYIETEHIEYQVKKHLENKYIQVQDEETRNN